MQVAKRGVVIGMLFGEGELSFGLEHEFALFFLVF